VVTLSAVVCAQGDVAPLETTARRFLAELPMGYARSRSKMLAKFTHCVADTTARQHVLRVKSLLGYAHKLGYAPFNAGATIKVRSDSASRGATLAKRIITETEVALLIRAALSKRDRVLLEVAYAGGLRVSELVALTWTDVLSDPKPHPAQVGRNGRWLYPRGRQVEEIRPRRRGLLANSYDIEKKHRGGLQWVEWVAGDVDRVRPRARAPTASILPIMGRRDFLSPGHCSSQCMTRQGVVPCTIGFSGAAAN
jgi:integrase